MNIQKQRTCIGNSYLTEGEIAEIISRDRVDRSGIVAIFDIVKMTERECEEYFKPVLGAIPEGNGNHVFHYRRIGIQRYRGENRLLNHWYRALAPPRLQVHVRKNQEFTLQDYAGKIIIGVTMAAIMEVRRKYCLRTGNYI